MEIADVKRNMNRMVRYAGKDDVYMLTGCCLRRACGDGAFFYQVELADVAADSVTWAGLEEIDAWST